MQEYPVKRGAIKELPQAMVQKLTDCFGVKPRREGEHYQISYGALRLLDISLGKGGKTLVVHTESDTGAADEVILETNRRFRRYLDEVTGFSTKERMKKARSVETG
jgi:hypothetical protein